VVSGPYGLGGERDVGRLPRLDRHQLRGQVTMPRVVPRSAASPSAPIVGGREVRILLTWPWSLAQRSDRSLTA
jgi:hypothetical protein